jgi:hypothetical protein
MYYALSTELSCSGYSNFNVALLPTHPGASWFADSNRTMRISRALNNLKSAVCGCGCGCGWLRLNREQL